VEAGESARQILVKEPNLVQGHFLVGLLSLESRDRKTAFSAFQSVVKLNPDHAAAWAQLAKLYMTEGQVTLADAALRETRRIKPEEPIVLDLIGNTLSLMGEHATAKAFYARANTKQPNHPPFM
jgi:cytochrome c-type biogenesis protein CcmH/NrfG